MARTHLPYIVGAMLMSSCATSLTLPTNDDRPTTLDYIATLDDPEINDAGEVQDVPMLSAPGTRNISSDARKLYNNSYAALICLRSDTSGNLINCSIEEARPDARSEREFYLAAASMFRVDTEWRSRRPENAGAVRIYLHATWQNGREPAVSPCMPPLCTSHSAPPPPPPPTK